MRSVAVVIPQPNHIRPLLGSLAASPRGGSLPSFSQSHVDSVWRFPPRKDAAPKNTEEEEDGTNEESQLALGAGGDGHGR